MAKAKTNYTCTECGGVSNKWAGQCPACGQWNTLVETIIEAAGNRFSTQYQGLAQSQMIMRLTRHKLESRKFLYVGFLLFLSVAHTTEVEFLVSNGGIIGV